MTNSIRLRHIIAAFSGAVEMSALVTAVIALLSMGGDGLDRLLAFYIFMVCLPVTVVIGIVLGIRSVRSASPWGFALVLRKAPLPRANTDTVGQPEDAGDSHGLAPDSTR